MFSSFNQQSLQVIPAFSSDPDPGSDPGSGVLDGLDLTPDLFGGEAVEPALTDDNQDGKQNRQTQHGCLELPEEMFLHESRSTALVLLPAGLGAVHLFHVSRLSAGRLRLRVEVVAANTLLRHYELLQHPAGGDDRLHSCSFLFTQQSSSKHSEGDEAPEQSVKDEDSRPAAGDGDPTVALHQSASAAGRQRSHPDSCWVKTGYLLVTSWFWSCVQSDSQLVCLHDGRTELRVLRLQAAESGIHRNSRHLEPTREEKHKKSGFEPKQT